MKDKIGVFIIGILIGAIITTIVFLCYTKISTKDVQMNNLNGQVQGPENNGEEPPEKPDGSNMEEPPEMQDENIMQGQSEENNTSNDIN